MTRRPTGWQNAKTRRSSGLFFSHPNSVYCRLSPTEARKLREKYNAYVKDHVALVAGLRKVARS